VTDLRFYRVKCKELEAEVARLRELTEHRGKSLVQQLDATLAETRAHEATKLAASEALDSREARIRAAESERATAREELEKEQRLTRFQVQTVKDELATVQGFYEVECQRTVEAVERMIAAERSESALQAKVTDLESERDTARARVLALETACDEFDARYDAGVKKYRDKLFALQGKVEQIESIVNDYTVGAGLRVNESQCMHEIRNLLRAAREAGGR
jgi:chromosome segregation ATPase